MKRLIASCLVVGSVLIFVTVCVYRKEDKVVGKQNKIIILGFSQIGTENSWRAANTESIKEAARHYGIKLIFQDAHQDQQNQILAIRSFIAKKVDVIAFSPVVETGWEKVLAEAKEASIPVIITDRSILTNNQSLYKTLIGSDFYNEGKRAGNWLISNKLLQTVNEKNGNINIVELRGTEGSTATIGRKKGFEDAISILSNYKIIRSENGDFLHSKGKEIMESVLKTEKRKIDVVFSHNDDMALGGIEAMEEQGINPGKDITVISVDGIKKALEAMMKGKLNCSVECNPLIGNKLMETVKETVKGKKIPHRIIIEDLIFTQNSVRNEINKRKY